NEGLRCTREVIPNYPEVFRAQCYLGRLFRRLPDGRHAECNCRFNVAPKVIPDNGGFRGRCTYRLPTCFKSGRVRVLGAEAARCEDCVEVVCDAHARNLASLELITSIGDQRHFQTCGFACGEALDRTRIGLSLAAEVCVKVG